MIHWPPKLSVQFENSITQSLEGIPQGVKVGKEELSTAFLTNKSKRWLSLFSRSKREGKKMSSHKLKAPFWQETKKNSASEGGGPGTKKKERKEVEVKLGNGSEVVYVPKFLGYEEAWQLFHYLNTHIPWTRPTIRVFGRSSLQPRDLCYIADDGLPAVSYSGYQPHAHSWNDFPPLLELLERVHNELPGSRFNSLVLNKYKGGNDYVSWHSDDNKLYGPTPEIASVTFGCEREFLLKKKPSRLSRERRCGDEPVTKRPKRSSNVDQHSFTLKHGSMLVMRGYTQRDWLHSVPKRAKLEAIRINLTFRRIL